MMTMEDEMECEHGSDPHTCMVCDPKKVKGANRKVQKAGPVFVAKYDDHCPGCDLGIMVGHAVNYWLGNLYHEGCEG